MNLQSVKALEDCNHKRPNITVKTNEYYHVLNFNNAINTQIHNFGWDKTRLFKPVTKDNFDFKLIKYNYNSGKYYPYFTNEDILHYRSVENIKKNKASHKNELFSPKHVKKLEIEKPKYKKLQNKKLKIKGKKENPEIKKRFFCCYVQ